MVVDPTLSPLVLFVFRLCRFLLNLAVGVGPWLRALFDCSRLTNECCFLDCVTIRQVWCLLQVHMIRVRAEVATCRRDVTDARLWILQ